MRLLGASDLVADPPEGLVAALSETRPGRTATIDIGHDADVRSFALATGDLALTGRMTRIGALIDIDAELKAAEAAALGELVQVLSHAIVNALTPIASLAETAVAMLNDPDPMLPKVRDAVETVARRAAAYTVSAKATVRWRGGRPPRRNRALSLGSSAIWQHCLPRDGRRFPSRPTSLRHPPIYWLTPIS